MPIEDTVFVIDDDPDIRHSLQCLLGTVGLSVQVFESAALFLEAYTADVTGCVVLDVRMPGMGGLKLLEHLRERGIRLPVIVYTGYADVPMVLQAIGYGVFAFLEKPVPHQKLLDHVQDALAADRIRHSREMERLRFENLLARLSPREREVLDRMLDGTACKVVAAQLCISERTLEKHRKSIFDKLEARSLAQLIRMVVEHQGSRSEAEI
jgi:FixJ family two-component response regulator